MTPESRDDGMRDDVVRAAYHRAAETLDESPDPRVRARVLATATKAVARRSANPFGARRWPLSAAALVVVSVMTGVLVTQVAREEPERLTSGAGAPVAASASAPTAAAPPPPAATSAPATIVADETPALRRQAMPPTHPRAKAMPDDATALRRPALAAELKSATPAPEIARAPAAALDAPLMDAPAVAGSRPASGAVAFPQESSREAAQTPPAPKVFAPAPPAAPAPAAPSSYTPAAVPNPPAERLRVDEHAVDRLAKQVDAQAAERGEAATANRFDEPAAGRVEQAARRSTPIAAAPPPGRASSDPATPAAWVERIVALRAAGRDAEADRELAALRRRYPDFVVPPVALGAAGTR